MKKSFSLAVSLMLCVCVALGKQQAPPKQQEAPAKQDAPAKDDVVRISVTLVQVDVVVTGQKGRQVTDLKAEDFEILEDGRPQQITNFSYISTETSPTTPVPDVTRPSDKLLPPLPPARLRPDQARRTIALVVDDLSLSFESAHFVRESLKKFVDEQMQPGDLVAIIRTGAGMGALQQFTPDKRQLYAAIERVRWNPLGRGGISAFAPIGRELESRRGFEGEERPRLDEEMNQFREEIFSVGTLGALNFVVRGLRELPGRKSVILFSDGLPLFNGQENSSRVLEALRRLTDLANRASVVVYSIDARGLQTLGLTAADDVSGFSPEQVEARLQERRDQFFSSQEGLSYLAQQTGGFFIRNSNDLNRGINRVLDDQKGYYLIGYIPDEATFKLDGGRRRYHKIKVNVKRPGLKVRSRTGFYGVADEEARPVRRTAREQLIAALTSPFASGSIGLQLTSLFGHNARVGSYVRSLLHIDGRDVSFAKQADGLYKAVIDIVAVTFGDNGRVVDQDHQTFSMNAREDVYQEILKVGLVYTHNLQVKKPGAYQLRIAVRDHSSERIGSANQFIEVPNVSKGRLTLSGIAVTGKSPASSNTQPSAAQADGRQDQGDPMAGPAVRRIWRGMILEYGLFLYNAKLDGSTRKPQLETQVILLRDGKPVYKGGTNPVDPAQQLDFKQIVLGGRLRIGTDLQPGEYVLQVIATDKLAKEKQRMATQWIDFEVVK